MEDSSDIPQQVDEYFELGAETPPIEALIALSRALNSLPPGDLHDRLLKVPASVVEQLTLMLIDYRRLLEGVGAQITALPTPQQRDEALTAYQHVCRLIFDALSVIDCLLKAAP